MFLFLPEVDAAVAVYQQVIICFAGVEFAFFCLQLVFDRDVIFLAVIRKGGFVVENRKTKIPESVGWST